MRAYHNSRELKFRDPFGAVPMGGAVSLSIDTWDGEAESCALRVWVDKKGETIIPMEKNGGRFTVDYVPGSADIHWYSFIFTFADGSACRYGPQYGHVGGVGELSNNWDGPSYQLTAYVPRRIPDWYKNAVVYQIFPDRFNRGPDWAENAEKVLSKPRRGTPKSLVKRWSTPVGYKRAHDGRISLWEFYGGTLAGIREKLDYLAGMGVTAIYLNPIFEAASNHRYDTGDYTKIDGMLGDEDSFRDLAREARARGISIILDGVFNHTGCDSKYFNKFGNYPEPGACQSRDSRYYSWFRFHNYPNSYECWWGIDDLPDVEEHNEDFKNYIYGGPDSVVRRWLRAGASGWRLDVADELPDDFIAGIKSAMVEELGDDALLMGEVWEDASNKRSYGELRRYFLGDELDCVMNYPLRSGVLDFLTGRLPAWQLSETLMSLKENYPREAFYASLNLMGSHDRARVMTVLGGAPDPDSLSEADKKKYRLNDGQRGLAKGRAWLMALIQMTMPGVPCIYYGDEAGMEGYSDPFSRGPYPWGSEDRDMATIYRNAINLRRSMPVLVDGDFDPFCEGDDVFGFYRSGSTEAVAVAVNRCFENREIWLDKRGEAVTDILGGCRFEDHGDRVKLYLWPLGSAILHFHKTARLGRPMERGSGVLAHITSLPCPDGPGNIGAPARRFLEFLSDSRQKYWQILPLNPTDPFGSPYAGSSAFAGNISLLPESAEQLRRDFRRDMPEILSEPGYLDFIRENSHWLTPYCVFAAVKERVSNKHFSTWPEKYRTYSPALFDDPELEGEPEFQRYCQYRFELAWHRLRGYARELGITMIGDMPMYVSDDSADVWSNPELFRVDSRGRATQMAGVPPTHSDEGQLWGNPVYNWEAMAADGYGWWMRRFKRMMDLYDITRLDHFMGFESYWAVPAGKDPAAGHWGFGPGFELFKAAYDRFGPLPFMAEDLGDITPAIRALLSRCGFPGTDILQYQPDPLSRCEPAAGKVAYTGTHDNRTLIGWCKSRYPGTDPVGCSRILCTRLSQSSANVVILQLQDVLELDDSARMNTPGTTDRNWSWQAREKDFEGARTRLLSDTINSTRS